MPTKHLALRSPVHPAGGGGLNLREPVHKPVTSPEHPMAHESPAKVKYSPKAQKKIGKVMEEFGEGKLHSGKRGGGKGPAVKSRKQAVAIGISEAREAGLTVPKRRKKKA